MTRLLLAAALLTACTDETDLDDEGADSGLYTDAGLALLGGGAHTADSVEVTVVVTADQAGLDRPMDLAFNPRSPAQLWVVNQNTNGMSLITDVGTEAQAAQFFTSLGSDHFCVAPSALAFSDFGNFGTAQDTDDLTQGNLTPADFMGPVLWDDNLNIFDAGHGSHLDMLHNSPLGGGMAWDDGNAYWYFDGYHNSITWYDFASDHGYGGADHSDGIVRRYVEGQVSRFEGVPAHLDYDYVNSLLYIADTGNSRIAVLQTDTGTETAPISPNYDGTDQRHMEGAVITTLVDGLSLAEVPLGAPAGLDLHDGILYVTDFDFGRILAFNTSGELLDWLDVGRGGGTLGGLEVGPDGALYVTDVVANEILRIRPL